MRATETAKQGILTCVSPQKNLTRNLPGDEIPERDISLFCYLSCV